MTRWLVVGGGAAGCVVAARLSEHPDDEVVLAEAGPDHGDGQDPHDLGPLLSDPARIRADAIVTRRDGADPVRYEQGLGLGGSSLINAGVVVGDDDPAGLGTALPLEAPWALGGVGEMVLTAASDAHPVRLVRRQRRRVTAADAYLRPVLGRPNLTVLTGTAIVRLAFDGRRVVGAATADGVEHAADRVVVCAGAIHTPALLLRSGVDTPGIGEGLQDHPACSIALDLTAAAVDPTAPAIAVTVERPGRQIVAVNHLPGQPAMGALLAAVTEVASVGRVSLPDPDGPPHVELRQLSSADDLDRLVDVTSEALALLDTDAGRAAVARAYLDDAGTPTDTVIGDPDRLRAWVREHHGGLYHVAASCRMGVVTDHTGRVHGHEGLFVCDASLFTGVPAADPYRSVVLLAEGLATRRFSRDATGA